MQHSVKKLSSFLLDNYQAFFCSLILSFEFWFWAFSFNFSVFLY